MPGRAATMRPRNCKGRALPTPAVDVPSDAPIASARSTQGGLHAIHPVTIVALWRRCAGTAPPRRSDAVATVGGTHDHRRRELEKHVRPKLIEIENERYEALKRRPRRARRRRALQAGGEGAQHHARALEEHGGRRRRCRAPTDAEIQKVYDENKAAAQRPDARAGEAAHRRVPEAAEGATSGSEAFIAELKEKYKTTVDAEGAGGRGRRPAGRPEKGPARRADHDRSSSRTTSARSASAREDDGRAGGEDLRRQGAGRLPRLPAAVPRERASRRGGGELRQRAGQVLGVPREAVRRSDGARRRQAEDARRRARPRRRRSSTSASRRSEFKATIDKDLADGAAVGVNGTPAFFINGRMLSGAQPFEKFKEIIDEELAAAAS